LQRHHIEDFLSQKVRQVDHDEWFAAGGGRTMAQTLRSIPEDVYAEQRACLNEDGWCIALWGVTPDPDVEGVGLCWMVATEEASKWGVRLHYMFAKPQMQELEKRFRCLCAVPMASNTLHHKWLMKLGFEFLNVVAAGYIPFYLFARRSPIV
jgi:hypothetical protein